MAIQAPVTTRVNSTAPNAEYVRGAPGVGAGGQLIGQALQGLGDEFARLNASFKQRDQQTDKFNTLRDFGAFETEVAQALTEFKRNYSPDGKGYADAARAEYEKYERAFLAAKVPPEMQDEFRYRTGEVRDRVMMDSFKFQYDAGDAWYKEGVADTLNKARVDLDNNPQNWDSWAARMDETIDATDLPEAEKAALKKNARINLAATHYKAGRREGAVQAFEIGVGGAGTVDQYVHALINKEEGFVTSTIWDVNHWRVGYSSDTYTAPDGSVHKVTKGMTVTREDADRDLARRMSIAKQEAVDQMGDNWNALGPQAQAALLSVHWNYGKFPKGVVNAVRTGNIQAIAGAVARLPTNPERRQREAALILGADTIDADPRYDVIPYEDRLALRDDADREAAQIYNAQVAAQKAAADSARNSLFLGLYDGTAGQANIDQARESGLLSDYEDVAKAQRILKEKNETNSLITEGYSMIGQGLAFNPQLDHHKDILNALVKQQDGVTKLNAKDGQYFSDQIIPLVDKTGDIPTDVSGTLTGMVRGSNIAGALYALDALAQLRDTNEIAFNNRITSDVANWVDRWDALKGMGLSQEEMIARVRGGTTQAERQYTTNLRNEAEGILSRTENGVPVGKVMMEKALGSLGSMWSSPTLYANPLAQQAMQKEFNIAFADAYASVGNVEQASEIAAKTMARDWAVTSVGRRTLMKYPPERAGYKTIAGSYDWINTQARAEIRSTFLPSISDLSPQEQELVNYHRKNLSAIQGTPPDGTMTVNISTVVAPNGKAYNVPGYADGRELTEEEALARATKEGLDKYPSFNTPEEGDAAAKQLHNIIEKDLAIYQNLPDFDFELLSDTVTLQEMNRYKTDPTAPPPSYQAFIIDENGVTRPVVGSNGLPQRIYFQPTEEDVKADQTDFDERQEMARLLNELGTMEAARRDAALWGMQYPDEEDYQSAKQALEALQAKRGQRDVDASPERDWVRGIKPPGLQIPPGSSLRKQLGVQTGPTNPPYSERQPEPAAPAFRGNGGGGF